MPPVTKQFEVNLAPEGSEARWVKVTVPAAATDSEIMEAAIMQAGSFRERFAAFAQKAKEPGVQAIGALSPSEDPAIRRLLGQSVMSLVPETPEGLALSVLPMIPKVPMIPKIPNVGGALFGSAPRALISGPAIGGGIAALTSGGDRRETLKGAAQGAVVGGSAALGRGLQRFYGGVHRSFAGEQAIKKQIATETLDAKMFEMALRSEVPELKGVFTGKGTSAERLLKATEPATQTLSNRFQGLEDEIVNTVGPGAQLKLPTLAQLRGKVVQTPQGPQLDEIFSPREALASLKNVAALARQRSKTGELALSYKPRELDRVVDAEFRQVLTQAGHNDLAQSFARESFVYRRGTRVIRLLKELKKARVFEKGGPTEGGIDRPLLGDFLGSEGDRLGITPQEFPTVWDVVFQGQPYGSRGVSVPGLSSPAYVGLPRGIAVRPSLPQRDVPIGQGVGISTGPPRAGAGIAAGPASVTIPRLLDEVLGPFNPVRRGERE